jgi:type III pantothenate kinase
MPEPHEFLLIDISNSFTKIAFATREEIDGEPLVIPTDELEGRIGNLPCSAPEGATVVLSSVVPERNAAVERAFGSDTLITVSPAIELGVEIDYPEPSSIGADRLADAAAAVQIYGAPVVAIDFGTAVTFDIVSSEGAYVGGVIAPGLAAMTHYLYDQTALLPRIDLREPTSAIGKSTEGAMMAGAVIGYRGLVKEIIASIAAELALKEMPPVVATGGYAALISEGMSEIDAVHPHLTLEGLRIIGGLNVPKP